jgi:hypothetical protein
LLDITAMPVWVQRPTLDMLSRTLLASQVTVLTTAPMLWLAVAPTAIAQTPELNVINFSDLPLEEFYVSPSESDEWGENQLDETLGAYSEITITLAEIDLSQACASTYDILAVFESGTAASEPVEVTYWQMDLCEIVSGGSFAIFEEDVYSDDAPEEPLWVVNNSSAELYFLYAYPGEDSGVEGSAIEDPAIDDSAVADPAIEGSEPEGFEPEGFEPEGFEPEGSEPEGFEPEGFEPEGFEPEDSESEDSSTDLLNDSFLAPGASLALFEDLDRSICLYTFEAYSLPVEVDASSVELSSSRFSQDICSSDFITVGSDRVVPVTISNTTSDELRQLYLMPTNDASGDSPDRLSWRTLEPGGELSLPLTVAALGDTCPHDVFAIFYRLPETSEIEIEADGEILYKQAGVDLCQSEPSVINFTGGEFTVP